MRAIVITKPGDPDVLQVAERPVPEPAKGEVRVAVRAVGLNQADILQRRGKYPAASGWPADIPGLEFAGIVDKIGIDAYGFATGDRVFGLVGGGSYADYLVINVGCLAKVPDCLSFEEAASVPEAFITAYDAMVSQAHLASGENVLINGVASGVGTAAVQIAKALGATTIGTSRSADKIATAKEYGLDHGIVIKEFPFHEAVSTITNAQGVDVVLELVGGSYVGEDIEAAAQKGRIVLVGLMAGAKTEVSLAKILSKRLEIRGTTLRARPLEEKILANKTFEKHIVPLFGKGILKPVIDRVMPMTQAAAAHAYLEQGEHFGKIVLTFN